MILFNFFFIFFFFFFNDTATTEIYTFPTRRSSDLLFDRVLDDAGLRSGAGGVDPDVGAGFHRLHAAHAVAGEVGHDDAHLRETLREGGDVLRVGVKGAFADLGHAPRMLQDDEVVLARGLHQRVHGRVGGVV